MAIKCRSGGNLHEHGTVKEVQMCWKGNGVPVDTMAARPENIMPSGPKPAARNAQQNAKAIDEGKRQAQLAREGKPHAFTSKCAYCVAGVGDPALAHGSDPLVGHNQTHNDRLSDAPNEPGPTEPQLKYIQSLLKQHKLIASSGLISGLTKRSASKLIDDLKNWDFNHKLIPGTGWDPAYHSADGDPEGYGDPKPFQKNLEKSLLPNVPAGHYAVPSLTGNNDLDFFRVDRKGEDGKSGKTFIKRIIGGHPDTNIRFQQYRDVLEAIVKAGPDKAALLYGQTIGRCSRCNRHLTDDLSRQYGMGPDCRSK